MTLRAMSGKPPYRSIVLDGDSALFSAHVLLDRGLLHGRLLAVAGARARAVQALVARQAGAYSCSLFSSTSALFMG